MTLVGDVAMDDTVVEIRLRGKTVNDDTLKKLTVHKKVKSLEFFSTAVTNAGLKELAAFAQSKTLAYQLCIKSQTPE